jgi:hypothetical protein
MSNQTNTNATQFGTIAQNIAPYGVMMAIFALVYAACFGLTWGWAGWTLLGLVCVAALIIVVLSVRNVCHAKQFPVAQTAEGQRIVRTMGILSGITYSTIWLLGIILAVIGQAKFIMPMVTLLIGFHFVPQAKIMSRKIDYFVAPVPIFAAVVAIYLGCFTNEPWTVLYAVAGAGGATATLIYGCYIIYAYRRLMRQYGIER